MSDEYEHVARSKLKLKTDSNKISKKKKKDKKNRDKLEREHEQHKEALNDIQSSSAPRRTMTKAELSFKKMQEKMVSGSHLQKKKFLFFQLRNKWLVCLMQCFVCFHFQQEKRIMEKASQTHKQRVEKFNEHLDNLTEHFDIPKVSWTK